ncbi:MAG: efflux RND transporter periplasmic adaptor subunit [Myxococcota bacterium]
MTLLHLLACGSGEAQEPHAGHGGPAEPGAIVVAPDVADALGVRTEPARAGDAAPTHHAPATVRFDPARVTRVTLVAGGQLREVRVPRAGEAVRRGAVLARAWAPEVAAAAQELALAGDLGEPWRSAARGRLRALDAEGASEDGTWSVRSPVAGLVVSRPASEGGWLAPGGLVAEIAAADARLVDLVTPTPPAPETAVTLAAGGLAWRARVAEVLPTAGPAGRSVRLVVEGDPPVGAPLVATWAGEPADGVWVPRGAVVDTGDRQLVFVATGGAYHPRAVTLGVRTADEVQVLTGLAAGEEVVAAGTFLFDAETQMQGVGHAHGGS